MVGRRRRGTSSSVESVDIPQLRYRPEATVLHTLPPDTHEDEWPTFELKDAVVYNKDGVQMKNALDVLLEGPFVMRGRMILEDAEQRKHLVSRVRAPVPIEITSCQRYSIGETTGGKPEQDNEADDADPRPIMSVLWVSGQGGWFEVNPAPAYVPIYRDICDAIKLYYTIYDIYDKSDARFIKATGGSADPVQRLAPLFLKYAVRVGNGITIEEVEQRCRAIAPFLISQMLDEPHFWGKTYFYQWLKAEHEDVHKKIWKSKREHKGAAVKQQEKASPGAATLPSRTRKESAAPSVEELPSTQRLASRGRSTRTASLDVTAPEPVLVPVPTRAKRVVKEEIEEQILPSGLSTRTRSSPQDRGQSSRESQAPKQPETAISPEPAPAPISAPPQTDGGDVFDLALPRIQAILDRLAEGKKGIQLSTLVNKIYFEHKFPNFKNGQSGSHRIPVEEFLHYNAKELLNNLDQVKYGDKDFYAWLQEKAGTKFSPIAIKPSDFPYPLIPRSKLSTPRVNQKDQGVAGTNHALSSLENEDDFGSSTYDHSQSPRAGKSMKTPGRYPKKSSLRLSSKKRPHSDIDDSESDSGSGAKKSHFFQDEDESMEDAGDANSNHEGDGTVQIVIQADKLPSTTPQGLHGTWTCDQEDCDYIVRGGDSAECEARIQRHFQDHERRMELVQLAMTEGNRGHVQINNLLEKIKKLGEQQQRPQPTRNGVVVPKPIKTNLIV